MTAARRAFTLIELLVVVAIIAILAAIAVPSFLNAQTRAKTSRAKADLRTLNVALEAYITDHGLPPLDYKVSRGDPQLPEMQPSTSGILHPGYVTAAGMCPGLTTPVAYIQNCWIDDPFGTANNPFDERKYTYNWFAPNPLRGAEPNPDYTFQEYDQFYGYWRLGSIGPDRQFFDSNTGSVFAASRVYDPTNGVTSQGNIWRSHKEGVVTRRPPLDELMDP